MRIQPVAIVLIVLAVLFIVLGVIYMTTTADNLPGFVPGATSPELPECGGDLQPPAECYVPRKYTKRGVAAFGVAAICLVGAWYTSGMRKPSGVDT